jgi:hypothetical protein
VRQLNANANERGTIQFKVQIGPTGAVQGVSALSKDISAALMECAKARIASSQFAALEGGSAVLLFPVTFQP